MCIKCEMKATMKATLLDMMAADLKPGEHMGMVFATLENLYMTIAQKLERGELQTRDLVGDEQTPDRDELEGIVVSEISLTTLYGLLHPSEVMRSRTTAMVGNLILAMAISLAWADEDELLTPREAFERFLGEKLDTLSYHYDSDEGQAARQAARDEVAEQLQGQQSDDPNEAERDLLEAILGQPVGTPAIEQVTDEQAREAVDQFLNSITFLGGDDA